MRNFAICSSLSQVIFYFLFYLSLCFCFQVHRINFKSRFFATLKFDSLRMSYSNVPAIKF